MLRFLSVSPPLIAMYVLFAALVAIALAGGAPGNAGAPITPSTTADEYDGVCDAHCSLRDAITAINADVPPGDTVELESGETYTLTIEDIVGVDEDLNETGDLDVTTTILIRSSGSEPATIEADSGGRVIEVREPVAQAEGPAAVRPAGQASISLILQTIVITGGVSAGQAGGGIEVGTNTTLNLTDSMVTGNSTNNSGAGIYVGGEATLLRSTVSDNALTAQSTTGAGIRVAGILTVANSTISGNHSTVDGVGPQGGGTTNGGGIAADPNSTVSMNFSTVSENEASQGAGVDIGVNAVLTAENSIIGDNFGEDCYHAFGTITSAGHNIDSDGTCGLTATGDQGNADPGLGPLQDNGGPTETHALLEGSPAIDSADETGCVETDQRGVPRPVGDRCDVGAYEGSAAMATETPPPTAAPTPTPTPPSGTATPTPTPAPTGLMTPTQMASPSPGNPPAENATWADDDCNGAVAATDALKKLQDIAAIPYNVEPGCPTLGDSLGVQPAGFGQLIWGDTDCDGDYDAVDALQILRSIAALPTNQMQPCPAVGAPIVIS